MPTTCLEWDQGLADLAVDDLEAARHLHGLEHAPVVGDQQQRARDRSPGRSPAARSRAGPGGSWARRARAGSPRGPAAAPAPPGSAPPGQRRGRPEHVRGPQTELGEQRTDLGARATSAPAPRRPRPAVRRRGTAPRAWSTSPTTTPGPSDTDPAASSARPSSAASSVDLPDPLAPVIATRSAQSTWRSTGPSAKAPRRTTAPARHRDDRPGPGRGRDLQLELPFLARLLHHLQALDQPVGLARLGGLLLGGLGAELAPDLVVVRSPFCGRS